MGKYIANSCQCTAGDRGSLGSRMLEAMEDGPGDIRAGPRQPGLAPQPQSGSRAGPHGLRVSPGHSLILWVPGSLFPQPPAGGELVPSPRTQGPSSSALKTLAIINTNT